MSKKNGKKYNPNKLVHRVNNMGTGIGNLVLAKALIPHLDERDIQRQQIAMFSALDTLRQRWDVNAFRALSHFYRVAAHTANSMKRPQLMTLANRARAALNELMGSKDDAPTLTDAQYQALRTLVLALSNSMAFTPLNVWQEAVMNAVAAFVNGVSEEYRSLPAWQKQAARAVLQGDTIRHQASELGRPEKDLAERVRIVGMIAHGLARRSDLPFPENITVLRKIAKPALEVLDWLDAGTPQVERVAA